MRGPDGHSTAVQRVGSRGHRVVCSCGWRSRITSHADNCRALAVEHFDRIRYAAPGGQEGKAAASGSERPSPPGGGGS